MDHSGSLELLLTEKPFAPARALIVSLMVQAGLAPEGATEKEILEAWLHHYCRREKLRVWSYMCRAALNHDAEALVNLRQYMGLPPFHLLLTTDGQGCNERRGQ